MSRKAKKKRSAAGRKRVIAKKKRMIGRKKSVAAGVKRKPSPRAARSRGKTLRQAPIAEEQRQAQEDIRRAVDDGMQDLRIRQTD